MIKNLIKILLIALPISLLFVFVGITRAQEPDPAVGENIPGEDDEIIYSYRIHLPLAGSYSSRNGVVLSPLDESYPLREDFDSSEGFSFKRPDKIYIENGLVHWNISRSGGQQFVYRDIPAFSGDVRLTVRGQINSWNNNCTVRAGIGDGFNNVGDQSGISINYGFTGGGCRTNGPVITSSGVVLDNQESYCNFTGNWLWINGGTQYTAELTISEGAASLSVPDVGKSTGSPVYNGQYDTLFVGFNGTGDWPSCSGTIDWIMVEPLEASGPSIEGIVYDSDGNRLVEADVELLSDGKVIDTTITNYEGVYKFPNSLNLLNPGEYSIRMFLRHTDLDTDDTVLQVHYGEPRFIFFDPILVSVETPPFYLSSNNNVQVPINFSSSSLKAHSSIPKERLDDLATIYFHSMQALTYGRDVLKVTHDHQLPIKVFAYRGKKTHYVFDSGDIYIEPQYSDRNHSFRPMNREWHEMFHELMDDTIDIPILPKGDTNHDGFVNSSSSDSWVEGWAEFWTTQLKDHLGEDDPHLYVFGNKPLNLETNWEAPSHSRGELEEFAVASLLWDLVDGIDTRRIENDPIEIELETLWDIIGTKKLIDMKDVYDELKYNKIGVEDTDSDGLTDLDEVFVEHGFFVDTGNTAYDAGEEIGRAANTKPVRVYNYKQKKVWVMSRPDRRNLPLIPGANILISVVDENGNQVVDGTIEASVEFEGDASYYNYSYSANLLSVPEGLLDIHPPTSKYSAKINLHVVSSTGEKSDMLIIDNNTFWDNLHVIHPDYVAIHEFEIGEEGIITEIINIDIKPGGLPNSINCSTDNGVIPVAILTTNEFDALTVDHTTVTFQGTGETHIDRQDGKPRRHEEDVDGDGDMDLVFHFRKGETDLTCNSEIAILKGLTFNGFAFEGFDSVRMVPENR